MDRYTVLIADDEEEIIQAIMRKINWEGLGFSVIGAAGNGAEALKMVGDFQPDIVMTDIRMPYMDGLELSKRIRAEFPMTRIILLTGFDEVEYAKEALLLEAEEFILKPFDSMELTNVFTHLKIKMDQEISEKRNLGMLQEYYSDLLPFLQADFYTALIEGRIREDEIPGYLSSYHISLEGPCYCCLAIRTLPGQKPGNMDSRLLSASVDREARKQLGERWQGKCFSHLGDTILILQLENEGRIPVLTDECDQFCTYVRRIIGAMVAVGIGGACTTIQELPRSYDGAKEALSCRAARGSFGAVNIREARPWDTAASCVGGWEVSRLLGMLPLGSREDILKAVGQYLEHISPGSGTPQQRQLALMELAWGLSRFSAGSRTGVRDFPGDVGELYGSLLEMEPEALEEWLISVLQGLGDNLIDIQSRQNRSFVLKAKEYVRGRYWEEGVSLEAVSGALGVSKSFLSAVFKRETGISFMEYVTGYRMDQAARLLVETNEKSHMIARDVGYPDPNFFSYVFKSRFGVPPSRYRVEHGEEGKGGAR